jgi:hypothetical protein
MRRFSNDLTTEDEDREVKRRIKESQHIEVKA